MSFDARWRKLVEEARHDASPSTMPASRTALDATTLNASKPPHLPDPSTRDAATASRRLDANATEMAAPYRILEIAAYAGASSLDASHVTSRLPVASASHVTFGASGVTGLASDLARLARSRPPEPVPLVGRRAGWMLAAASIVISVATFSFATNEPAEREPATLVLVTHLPPPPRLPPPPSVAPPDHYLALARTAWRELSP